MDKNSNHFFNYSSYEQHLSPFGRKVLHVLIQNWRKGETERDGFKNISTQQTVVQKKRILQFRDSNTNRTYESQLNLHNQCNISTPVNNDSTNLLKETIKSSELLTTIAVNTDIDEENHCREDLISPVMSRENNVGISNNYEFSNVALNTNAERNDTNIQKSNAVAWDDMFDSELLLSDKHISEEISELVASEDRMPSKLQSSVHDIIPNRLAEGKDIEMGNKPNNKRKNQIKNTDTLPKKIKNVKESSKNIYRKDKYTKSVKNWLNDVNLHNYSDEGVIVDKETNMQNGTIGKLVVERNITIDRNKPTKKVVQAQLANKDGVMKFSKPKNSSNVEINQPIDNDESQNKDKPKEKKSKAKFVAPIKSQIPVKDIVYEVYTINGCNVKEYKLSAADKEVVAVLVYSNDFNQLNCHYTDDSCEPEGLLLNIESEFYYFKGVAEVFREVIPNVLKHKLICYEGKDVINYLASVNIDVTPEYIIDAKIGSSILDPDNPPENFSDIQKVVSYKPQYTIASACPLQKAAWYTTLLKDCVATMNELLIQNKLWSVFVDVEMRLLPVVAAMERRGVSVDLQKLRSMEELLTTRMKVVEQKCYKAARRSFQINSHLQISAILYDELQLDKKCNVKIRETLCKGTKSTSETMLRSLISEHPLPRLILEYRHLHKAHATFLAGIAQHVRDGVVKPTWVQTAAATGRIASNNPNLQAIPKAPFNLVMYPDGEETDVAGDGVVEFRSVYCARPGCVLVAADFKHVECRVFAHVAADTALLHALTHGQDLFTLLAAKWLQKSEVEVTSEDRERTKRIIYASMYGAGTRKLMDILNINYDQTLAIVASFNRTFPSLKSFGRSVVSRCEQNGGKLSTICGRTRQFKNITNEDFALRSQAERQAVNFVIQGSAADLCKMAMILTNEEFVKHNPRLEAHLVLQIHDELVWEVKDEHLQTAIAIIKRVMESCGERCGMSVHLPVDIRAGRDWANMAQFVQ